MDPTIIQLQNLIRQVNNLQEELDIADDIIENLFEDTDTLLEYALKNITFSYTLFAKDFKSLALDLGERKCLSFMALS